MISLSVFHDDYSNLENKYVSGDIRINGTFDEVKKVVSDLDLTHKECKPYVFMGEIRLVVIYSGEFKSIIKPYMIKNFPKLYLDLDTKYW